LAAFTRLFLRRWISKAGSEKMEARRWIWCGNGKIRSKKQHLYPIVWLFARTESKENSIATDYTNFAD
jgi:hypothetical protein